MTTQLRDFVKGFRSLELGDRPVIAHASLSAFGRPQGGAETLVCALLAEFPSVIMPMFTYKTMITPLTGPVDNGITYGTGEDQNHMAEFFTPTMPADPLMGIVPETLRQHPRSKRSMHPILSFAGVNAEAALKAQTMADPLASIGVLAKRNAWVLLLGVDHTVNTSIHYAEKLAGRKQFIRWALTPEGVRECPGFPGCSAGFQAIAIDVEGSMRRVKIGNALVQAVPLKMLLKAVAAQIKKDPLALLCQQEDCERCNQIRTLLAVTGSPDPVTR